MVFQFCLFFFFWFSFFFSFIFISWRLITVLSNRDDSKTLYPIKILRTLIKPASSVLLQGDLHVRHMGRELNEENDWVNT